MKTVLLVRHAKSSWEEVGVEDFDRSLNDRGKRDAPEMARRLRKKDVQVDALISSPAKRAKKTAALFAGELGLKKDKIILVPELYHAGPQEMFEAIAAAPGKADTIAIFCHNPGITDFANGLTDTKVDDMPTSAIFAVQADIKKWDDFKAANKSFLFFDYPKSAVE